MRLRSLPALLLVTTLAIGTSTILRAESTTYPQFHFGHTPVPPAEELHPFTAIQPQAVGAEQSVDVLVLVNPHAVYDDGENVYAGASLASLFVRRLNESTQRSVRLQGSYFKLVRVATIDYPNTNTAYQTLSDLTYANAQFSQVPSLAAKPGADIVVYFAAPEARWAGMSWQYTADAYNRDLRFTEFSYSVVSAFRGDMDNFAGLHEAGHIMGLHHDPDNGCDGALPYACGYMDPEHGIGTIMSYYAWSSNVWSDPDTLMDGRPAGTVTQDNAKALSLTLPRVRARRTQTVPEDAVIELDTPNVQAGVPIAGQTLVPDAMVELSSDNQASWVAAVSHGYSWSAPPEAHLQNWQNEPGPHDLWLRVNKGRPLWHEITVVETGIVSGAVTFRETGESVIGALVLAGGVATTTDALGHYSLFVAKATHTVSAVLRTADQSCTGQVEVEVLPNQAVAQPISVLCTPLSRAYIPLIPIGNQVSVSIQSFEGSQRAMNVRIVDLLGRAETLNSG